MIYSNTQVEAQERTFEFGTIHQVCLGEIGRRRKLMALTCPKDLTIESGINKEISISTTRSGKPRISKITEDTLYMLLSSEGGYTRRGDGTIKVLKKERDKFEILARGNGADGDAGRIGSWSCMLLKVLSTDAIVRVRTSGGGYGTPSDLYLIHNGEIYHCHIDELQDYCDGLDIDLPCEIILDNNGLKFGDDWIDL